MLEGKRVLLGITGGIAAYKAVNLIRILKKKGAEVKCILTPASSDFIAPLTVATLSENPAYQVFWNKENGVWTNHVKLGAWADLFIVAPLTANTLAKLATGLCDNLLTATYLSAKCPVIVAPAMDLDMYAHQTTEANLELLVSQGVEIIPAETGFLASGLEGKGRMAEPETIAERIDSFFRAADSLKNERILITAGPTYEGIDPVRFIGNHSSGKMGFSLAEAALQRGARVVLISGPTNCELHHEHLTRVDVITADEMLEAVNDHFESCTGGIFSAAVSDYKPEIKEGQKIKKSDEKMTITLVKNPDILKITGQKKSRNQWLVGFALETQNALSYAKKKLKEKNLDFIVLNTLEDEGAGFGHDTNKITLLDKSNNSTIFELTTKKKAADNILTYLTNYIK
jgi:phosphopantothenoylcysteine decarboxylase/phosphopantothenate--cysteine ligase